MVEVDRDKCDCDGKALVARQVADWKPGNPTGVFCDNCAHVFGYTGGFKP